MVQMALQIMICVVAGFVAVTATGVGARYYSSLPRAPLTAMDWTCAALAPLMLVLLCVMAAVTRRDVFLLVMAGALFVGAAAAFGRLLYYALQAHQRRLATPRGW